MRLQSSMEPTILIVDDEPDALTFNERYIHRIDQDRRDKAGITKFNINKADTVELALKLLTRHITSPYDIVLLDMELPGSPDEQYETGNYLGQEDEGFRGFEILSFIEKTKAAQAVIVVSAHPVTMLSAFRKGSFDFITKPRTKEDLQGRVLVCWSRLLLMKSRQMLAAHIADMFPYAEKGLAYRFTNCFSDFVQTVAHSAEDIEKYMHERYGLDRRKDSQDFFFRCLKWQEDSAAKIQKEWADLQAAVLPPEESARAVAVDALVTDIHRELRPCLVIKNAELDLSVESTTEALSFDDDVRAVLKEIIVGALGTLHDLGEIAHTFSINVSNANGQIKVGVEDQLKPMSSADAELINRGSNITPARRFEREWGLSVVQHIAMRGGGRLEVKPRAHGNVINYFVPPAR